MKVIVYEVEGGKLEITPPSPGERLCNSITLADGTTMASVVPVQADRFLRGWPVKGAIADWAETEDEWLLRVAGMVRPEKARRLKIVELPDLDRATRDKWVFCEKNGVKLG